MKGTVTFFETDPGLGSEPRMKFEPPIGVGNGSYAIEYVGIVPIGNDLAGYLSTAIDMGYSMEFVKERVNGDGVWKNPLPEDEEQRIRSLIDEINSVEPVPEPDERPGIDAEYVAGHTVRVNERGLRSIMRRVPDTALVYHDGEKAVSVIGELEYDHGIGFRIGDSYVESGDYVVAVGEVKTGRGGWVKRARFFKVDYSNEGLSE